MLIYLFVLRVRCQKPLQRLRYNLRMHPVNKKGKMLCIGIYKCQLSQNICCKLSNGESCLSPNRFETRTCCIYLFTYRENIRQQKESHESTRHEIWIWLLVVMSGTVPERIHYARADHDIK